MPDIYDMYKNKMTWPRLILKALVEIVIAYHCYKYNGRRDSWDCFSNGQRQPNADNNGVNMTEKFTLLTWVCFFLCVVGLINCAIEIANKFVDNRQLTVLTGVIDTLLATFVVFWVVWASVVRLSKDGRICAGATMNVSEETQPYAYEQGMNLIVILMLSYSVPPVLLIATNCGCL